MFYVNTKKPQQSQHNIGKNNFLVFFQIWICVLNQSVHIRNKVKLEYQKYRARLEGFSLDNNVQIQLFQSAINSCYTVNMIFDYTQTHTASMRISYPVVQLQSALVFQNKTICLAVNTKRIIQMYLSALLFWKPHRSYEMFAAWQSKEKNRKRDGI